MAIDVYNSFLFSNNNSPKAVSKEMYYLFDMYRNGMNGKELKYFGYKLARDGEFGLILSDRKDTNKYYVPRHEIFETLKEEINIKCSFTVCIYIDSLRLIADDWMERMDKHFKQAKKNGQNQVCLQ